MTDWQDYYKNTKNNPPSQLLKEALSFVVNRTHALDLGSGALKDSKYLLSQGFEVTAVDREKTPEIIADPKFHFIQSSFTDYNFPKNHFDLVNAQFSLPFNGPLNFQQLWNKIQLSLKIDGILTLQLFGLNDEWNTKQTDLIFLSKEAIENLLENFYVIELEEIDKDGKLANGMPKHWHYFNIIARKN